MKKPAASVIAFCITAATLYVGLRPFNFYPPNGAHFLENNNGISFESYGIAYGCGNARRAENVPPFDGDGLTIELAVTPGKRGYRYLASILTLCDARKRETILWAQWKSHLIVRKYGPGTRGQRSFREIGVQNLLQAGELRIISVASDGNGTRVYANGSLVRSEPGFTLLPGGVSEGFLLLGNSPGGVQPWQGVISGLAAYDRALADKDIAAHYRIWRRDGGFTGMNGPGTRMLFTFDEHSGNLAIDRAGGCGIIIPPRFRPMRWVVLVPPWEDFRTNPSYLGDMLINVIGFMPFGFFMSVFLGSVLLFPERKAALTAILLGAGTSLAIELLQVYLPGRSSQTSDVVLNILGTGCGAAMLQAVRQFNRRLLSRTVPRAGE
jgi:hypothetical protein